MSDFIERLTVKNYGCVKDASVELTPLHAFIGPNDSGKSTLLRAMRTLVQLAGDRFWRDERDAVQPFNPGALLHGRSAAELGASWGSIEYHVAMDEETGELRDTITSGDERKSRLRGTLTEVQLVSGEWISAQAMSEGLLYYLAFAAIPYLNPPAVILVEEPENGLHPARIAEVMRILREVSKSLFNWRRGR